MLTSRAGSFEILFSCLKMTFFISNVWCSLRLLQLKTAEQIIVNRLPHLKRYKTEIKILAYPGLAQSGFENPAQMVCMWCGRASIDLSAQCSVMHIDGILT